MLIYTINRILQLIPIVFILSFIVFMMVEALPGDIIDTMGDIDRRIDRRNPRRAGKRTGLGSALVCPVLAGGLGDIVQGNLATLWSPRARVARS